MSLSDEHARSQILHKSVFPSRYRCAYIEKYQVPLILAYLMSDRRIAKAAHPIINAWRCQVGSVLHQGRSYLTSIIYS